MSQPSVPCAAVESQLTRVLRLLGTSLLVGCGAILTVLTRPVIESVHLSTFFRFGLFVAALGMLASSAAAFWWRDAALRRVEWAAYLGLALLIAGQFITGHRDTGNAQPVALIFALLVVAIVTARLVRRTGVDVSCKCG